MAHSWAVRVLVLAVIREALAFQENDLDGQDEVMLLQTGAAVKVNRRAAQNAESAEAQAAAGTVSVGTCQNFCSDFSGSEVSEDTKTHLSDAIIETALSPAAGAEVVDDVPLTHAGKTSTPTFSRILQLLIGLIVLDAARRIWSERTKSSTCASTVPSRDSWQALMHAAMKSEEKTCLHILDSSCGDELAHLIHHKDAWGCTALHAAAKGGSVSVVKRLLSMGASVLDRDAWDETPLHLAARAGKSACCEQLLAEGAEVDPLNADDRTPLVVAAEAGSEPTARLLLDRGATAGGLSDEELPPLLAAMLFRELLVASSRPGAGLPSAPDSEDFNHSCFGGVESEDGAMFSDDDALVY